MGAPFSPRDIVELAEFLLASGYTKAKTGQNQDLFSKEEGGETLFLSQAIDFEWLRNHVDLKPPLEAIPERNCIVCDETYRTIQGGP